MSTRTATCRKATPVGCCRWSDGNRPKHNVKVLNDTGDFYRFFDATPHAEFLHACVRKTIDEDLRDETCFLKNFDQFRAGIESMIDMPPRTLNTLFGFLRQNNRQLSKRAQENEFAELRADEIRKIEELYRASFGAARRESSACE